VKDVKSWWDRGPKSKKQEARPERKNQSDGARKWGKQPSTKFQGGDMGGFFARKQQGWEGIRKGGNLTKPCC